MNKRFMIGDMVFEVLPTTRTNVNAFREAAMVEELLELDVFDYTLRMLPYAVKPVGEATFEKLNEAKDDFDVNQAQEAIRAFLPDGTTIFRALASF